MLSGNEAVAYGALLAGVRFFAGYPITPASEIFEWLAAYLPKFGGRVVQSEDEIAALGMSLGAAFGGVKAMTATSGPGLSLMSEMIGLASMAEIPVVIVDVQRGGPSTGMPTKEAQSDLNCAIHGTHGEAPKVVLAPQSVADCLYQTINAVNIAHRFHIPVIVLSGQSLSHRTETMVPPDLGKIEVFQEKLFEGNGAPGQRFCRYDEQAMEGNEHSLDPWSGWRRVSCHRPGARRLRSAEIRPGNAHPHGRPAKTQNARDLEVLPSGQPLRFSQRDGRSDGMGDFFLDRAQCS